MYKYIIWLFILLPLVTVTGTVSTMQQTETEAASTDSLTFLTLDDGTELEGYIISEDAGNLTILTLNDLQITIKKSDIRSMQTVGAEHVGDKREQLSPSQNYSRLLFATTGRPMEKGTGYVSVHYIFFPGVGYGITDNFSVFGGFSIIPGLSLGNQIMYIAPRYALQFNDRYSGSVGTIFFTVPGEVGAGLLYGVGTYGSDKSHLSAGLAFGYASGTGEVTLSKNPVIMIGGALSLTNKLSLISENWFLASAGLSIMEQPFTLALRFFGDQLSFDAGFLIVGEILKSGFPIPWLSAAYHF